MQFIKGEPNYDDEREPLRGVRKGPEVTAATIEPRKRIFVVGSNREGRHGRGAALVACQRWGAKYGQAEGLQGESYAIVTKELRKNRPPVTLQEVAEGVANFIKHATHTPQILYLLTPIGCGLAGFKVAEIAPMFRDAPANVMLPPAFANFLGKRCSQ